MKATMILRVILHPVSCLAWSSRLATFSALQRHVGRTRTTTTTFRRWVSTQEEEEKTRDVLTESQSLLVGGDFAGYSAQCDPTTGDVKPVPVYLVPPSMLEWGQHPNSLEVIASEDFSLPECKEEQRNFLDRVCLTVLPETGCGVDNLEVQKASETGWRIIQQSENSVGLIRKSSPTATTIETIFRLPERDHRLRVSVTVSDQSGPTAIAMSLERRFETSSTRGSRADGGGLDGASVSRWMGGWISKEGVKILEDKHVNKQEDQENAINLPANVTMQFTTEEESSVLRVSHASGKTMHYKWETGQIKSVKVVS